VLTPESCGLLVFLERGAHRLRALPLDPAPRLGLVLAGNDLNDPDPAPGDIDDAPGQTGSGRFRFPRGLMIDAPDLVSNPIGNAGSAPPDEIQLLVVDAVDRIRRVSIPVDSFTDPRVFLTGRVPTSVRTARGSSADGAVLFSSRDDSDGAAGVLRSPSDVDFLDDGRLLVLDRVTGRLRIADLHSGALTTVSGLADGVVPDGEPVPAALALPLSRPEALVRDGDVVYVADTGAGRIRRFFVNPIDDPARWTTDFLPVVDVDGEGPFFGAPAGLSVDPQTHDLYVADRAHHVVYAVRNASLVDATPTVELVAGRVRRRGFAGDADFPPTKALSFVTVAGETFGARAARLDEACTPTSPPATDALLNAPEGVLFTRDARGREWLFVADTGNNRVRRVDLEGSLTISTVLGDGSLGSGGTGSAATSPVAAPRGLAVDSAGNLFVTSTDAVRFVGADGFGSVCSTSSSGAGVADGVDGVATVYGDGTANFPETVTRCLVDLAVDPSSASGKAVVYAVDSCIGMLVRLERSLDACTEQ
jgi:hypothetical protein